MKYPNSLKQHGDLIWNIANLLGGPYRPPQHRRVMIPLTVLRLLDCVLESSKDKVITLHKRLKAEGKDAEVIEKILASSSSCASTTPASSPFKSCWATRTSSPPTWLTSWPVFPAAPARSSRSSSSRKKSRHWKTLIACLRSSSKSSAWTAPRLHPQHRHWLPV